MQLTIDSSEPLAHVLRVVGSLYDREITVAAAPTVPASSEPEKASPPAPPKPRGGRARAGGRRHKGAAQSGGRVRNADVRAWAREQGLQVSDRGRISDSIVAAYREAHGRG